MRIKTDASGLTLVETLIALVILSAGLLSLAQVLAFSVAASKTHGRDATKATASAHDKMEELIALQFDDTSTNLTVAPPFTNDGAGLTAGGSIPPAEPVEGYVDYLDTAGNRINDANAAFTRQWQIIDDAGGADMKRIIVNVTSNRSFAIGERPTTTILTEKTP